MRVAIIAHGLSDGGAERVASITANYFVSIGHEVLYIAVYSPEREYHLDSRVKYYYADYKKKNKMMRFISRSEQVARQIKKFDSDIAVSFLIKETFYASVLNVAPIGYSLRIDPADVMRKKSNAFFCKYCYGRSPAVIFQTKDARDYFSDKIRENGVVIGNPLTNDLPYWNVENHEKTVITACRLTEQKNLKMLINGFALFHKVHPEYRLKIYGKGPELERMQKLCLELQIEAAVEFPGYSKNIHQVMSKSGIFALTSDFEGLSNSMLEALAIGLPTVCTDCPPGGAAEYIRDGENGMLIPVGDVNAFYHKLCMLADDPALCKRMSQSSQRIRETLDEKKVMEQWNRVIQSVIKQQEE